MLGSRIGRNHGLAILRCCVFFAIALWIGISNLEGSGPQWPDAPQYANAGAMIHDWLLSGDFLNPWLFAERNYVHYPGFHMPYHPPVYPGLLGLFFLFSGVSYKAARIFISLCLWGSGCFFYGQLKRTGIRAAPAFWCTVLFLTTPQIAYWSRDTMSEIPGMVLILAASYAFVRWLQEEKASLYVLAFLLALAAFLSRHLTAGILPAWLIWTLLSGKIRKVRSWLGFAMPALYLGVAIAWVRFSRQYAVFETSSGDAGPNRNYAAAFSGKVLVYYLTQLPSMLGWPMLLAATLGLILVLRSSPNRLSKYSWLSVLCGYWVFVMAVGIYDEKRYFIYALPAFPAWIAVIFGSERSSLARTMFAYSVVAGCLGTNVAAIRAFPQGLVGYAAIAQHLSMLTETGNVLVAVPLQSQLMFEYRSRTRTESRSFIRADRTLVVRNPSYTNAPGTIGARSAEDVMTLARKGRIRYVITSDASQVDSGEQIKLLTEVLRGHPEAFAMLQGFPLRRADLVPIEHETVNLWRFTGDLPTGPSELPVIVPTAGFVIQPRK